MESEKITIYEKVLARDLIYSDSIKHAASTGFYDSKIEYSPLLFFQYLMNSSGDTWELDWGMFTNRRISWLPLVNSEDDRVAFQHGTLIRSYRGLTTYKYDTSRPIYMVGNIVRMPLENEGYLYIHFYRTSYHTNNFIDYAFIGADNIDHDHLVSLSAQFDNLVNLYGYPIRGAIAAITISTIPSDADFIAILHEGDV